MPSFSRAIAPVLLLAALLSACTPTFNWREVPMEGGGLVALLPCKPDRASRALPLGSEAVMVEMAGCEAGGATFAVARAGASSAAQAESWLTAWQAATRTQLAGQPAIATPGALPRADARPAPVRLDADAGPTSVHVLWFAQTRGAVVSLYQATVVGRPSSPDALSAFFDGLRLP